MENRTGYAEWVRRTEGTDRDGKRREELLVSLLSFFLRWLLSGGCPVTKKKKSREETEERKDIPSKHDG